MSMIESRQLHYCARLQVHGSPLIELIGLGTHAHVQLPSPRPVVAVAVRELAITAYSFVVVGMMCAREDRDALHIRGESLDYRRRARSDGIDGAWGSLGNGRANSFGRGHGMSVMRS